MKKQKETELSETDFEQWVSSNKPLHTFPLDRGLRSAIKIDSLILSNEKGVEEVAKIGDYIDAKISQLPCPDESTLNEFKNELLHLGLEKHSTYLFIPGHILFDNVVLHVIKPMFNKIISSKRTTFHSEIHEETDNKRIENIQNNLGHFEKMIMPIELAMRTHKYFDNCPFAYNIMNDINTFTDNH